VDHTVELTVAQGGRGWGSLTLMRQQGATPFGPKQEQALAQLAPYIAHAVRTPDRVAAMAEDPADTTVVEVDRRGQVLAESPGAAEVLLRETRGVRSFARLPVTEWFRDLVSGLCIAHPDHRGAPPLSVRRTPWGEFTMRAYPLIDRELAPAAARRFVIHVERREPRALRLLRGGFALGLSERQRELCLQLGTGDSYAGIAGRMRLRPSTVIDHIRKIHDRLDVHDRGNLLRRLHQAAARPLA
jgi:DNA-binding CsgD family transcriptional regulator